MSLLDICKYVKYKYVFLVALFLRCKNQIFWAEFFLSQWLNLIFSVSWFSFLTLSDVCLSFFLTPPSVFVCSRTTASRPHRRVSSSCVCRRTPARPSWPSGSATPSTTAAPSTWTTTCCPGTWTTPRARTRTTEAAPRTPPPPWHTHTEKHTETHAETETERRELLSRRHFLKSFYQSL